VERRFRLYGSRPDLIDYSGRLTLGGIQQAARLESLIAGDVLVILRQDQKTNLPQIQLVAGERVQTPYKGNPHAGNKIEHGVEMDKRGRQVAYWYVSEPDPKTAKVDEIRIPAFGLKTGRKTSWLVYGSEKLLDEVRGQPLLSVVLQSLKEIDRYKDATLRKATLNSILAMFIKKTETKMGTLPISGSATKRTTGTIDDATGTRSYNIADQIPGLVIEELQVGEEPVPGSTAGTDVNFGPFETAVLTAIAWSMEIPPEILLLSFNANYSASQAALNEFKMTLNMRRKLIGDQELQPYYVEWLISSVLTNRIQANGFLESWRDPMQYDVFAAWTSANWSGAIKPSTDVLKLAKGYKTQIEEGLITRHQASQELNGASYIQTVKQLKRENALLADALTPLLELKQKFGEQQTEKAINALGESIEALEESMESMVDN